MKTSKPLLTSLLMLFVFNLMAQIPQTISFQGILKDSNGDIVADASYTMEFELYDALTAGTKVWGPETHAVTTKDGLYAVQLGGSGQAITNSTSFASGYYLQIKVNSELLSPRIELSVSPYAFIARSVQGTDNVMPATGNVGIGTTTPTSKLDVAGTVTATEFVGGASGLTGLPSSPWTGTPDISFSGGNVGIGTTTPSANLHLYGTTNNVFRVESSSATEEPYVYLTNAAGSYGILTDDNKFFIFDETASLNRFAIDGSGQVGIGTVTPATKLDVAGTVTATAFSGDGSGLTGLPSSPWTGSPDISYSAGNVGIGTISPDKALTIAGEASIYNEGDVGALNLSGYSDSPWACGLLRLDKYRGTGISNSTSVLSGDLIGAIDFRGYAGNNLMNIGAGINANASEDFSSTAGGSALRFLTAANGTTTQVTRMSITHDGKVGIGTVTPATKLDVAGTVTATAFSGDGSGLTGLPSSPWTGTTDIYYNGGQVGIGTNTPASMLHIEAENSDAGITIREFNGFPVLDLQRSAGTIASPSPVTNSNSLGIVYFKGYDGFDFFKGATIKGSATEDWSATNHGGDIKFKTTANGTIDLLDRMIIAHDGNVGIGITTPATALDVLGTVTATSFNGVGSSITSLNASNISSGALALTNGGTGATTAAGARTNLGVQALDADLSDLADGSLSGSKVGTGISASNITIGTIPDARLEATVDVARLNTTGGLHVGGTTDPGTDNLQVDGWVGIGGANPSYPLYVSSNYHTAFQLNQSYSGSSEKYGIFNNVSNGSGNINGIYNLISVSTTGNVRGENTFISSTGGATTYGNYILTSTLSTGINYGVFTTGEDYNFFDGNVGIGTALPVYKLDAESTSTSYVANFNKNNATGSGMIRFERQGSLVGAITESGGTMTYGAFTGSHLAFIPEPVERGYLVSMTGGKQNLNQMEDAEPVYNVELSTMANDPSILGAYLHQSEETGELNASYVMAVGNGFVWVIDQGKDLNVGDYLISSNIAGHAMLDDGQYEIAYAIARVNETVAWADVAQHINGVKHKKISVSFENFIINHKADRLESELDQVKKEIEKLKLLLDLKIENNEF